MRRLFSTFAGGLPGAGLLVLRLAAAVVLTASSLGAFGVGPMLVPVAGRVLQLALAVLLLAGLWTPVAGPIVALLEFVRLVARDGDPWADLLLAALGLALALVGPGAWSIDARLFGWRRIRLHDRRKKTDAIG